MMKYKNKPPSLPGTVLRRRRTIIDHQQEMHFLRPPQLPMCHLK